MHTATKPKGVRSMKRSVTVGIQIRKAQVPSGKLAQSALAHTTIAALRRHSRFTQAKAGSPVAAFEVVRDLCHPERITRLAAEFPGAVVVPVLALERTGVNMLPLAFAKFMGALGRFPVETEILQINKTHHTDSDAMHRLLCRPEFTGPVVAGQSYIVVDDVITSGSTVQALRLFIEAHGGRVVAFSALAGSFSIITGSSLDIAITGDTLHAIEAKFGLSAFSAFLRQARIAQAPEELTNSQARYLLSFRSLDSIRARLAPQHDRGRFPHAGHPHAQQLTFALA